LARDGLLKPLIFLTNCSEAARISSSVAGGSKLNNVLMFLHMRVAPCLIDNRQFASVGSGGLIQRLAKRVDPRDRWRPAFPFIRSAGVHQEVYRLQHERTAQMFFCQSVTRAQATETGASGCDCARSLLEAQECLSR
jgi:hypothetical protein